MLLERGEVLLDRVVDAEVDHLEAGALEHHRDQVLADVVDVALDRADHDLADRLDAGLGEERAQDRHPALHRIRGEQHLGHEQDAVAEIDADDAHALDEGVVQDALGRPAALEEDVRRLLDLGLEAVVHVVVHLLGELGVVERLEVELFLCFRHLRPSGARRRLTGMLRTGARRDVAVLRQEHCPLNDKTHRNWDARPGLICGRCRSALGGWPNRAR